MENKMIAVWATQRSKATAFERMMMARGDFKVFHEPFNYHYYHSHERLSDRKADVKPEPRYHYMAILQDLLEQRKEGPIFFKDLAFHISHVADHEFLSNFTNVFLTRHPKDALPSLFHVWPDFTPPEACYAELYQLYKMVADMTGKAPMVIDSDDLLRAPEVVVNAFCQEVDIAFMPSALKWEPTTFSQWDRYDLKFHAKLKESHGFQQTHNDEYLNIDEHPHLAEAYEYSLPHYQELYVRRFKPEEA